MCHQFWDPGSKDQGGHMAPQDLNARAFATSCAVLSSFGLM